MYFMSDPQALHVTRNVIPGKLGVDLHLHRVHIPLVRSVSLSVCTWRNRSTISFQMPDLARTAQRTARSNKTDWSGACFASMQLNLKLTKEQSPMKSNIKPFYNQQLTLTIW